MNPVILALESSGPQGSIALVGEDGIEKRFDCPRGRGGELFGAIEEILGSRPSLSRVVVGLGPGSYNGIRAAIAAGWGIAAARKVPVVGLSSLLGLGEGEYLAVGDARRGQYYFSHVRDGVFLREPCLMQAAELLAAIEPGLPVYASAPLTLLPQAEIVHPSAARLGALGGMREPGTEVPEPLYLKPAFITTPKPAS